MRETLLSNCERNFINKCITEETVNFCYFINLFILTLNQSVLNLEQFNTLIVYVI